MGDSKKRILVTGATGFIGSAVAQRLAQSGDIVVKTTRRSAEANGVDVLYLDLSLPKTILDLAKHPRFDLIVHIGAQIAWSKQGQENLLLSNTVSTGLLVDLASKCNARLIFASMALVCGVKTKLITTDSPVKPDTDYARTKWLAEEIIKVSGIEYCILRIGGVFGLNGPGHLGLNSVIRNSLQKKIPCLNGSGNVKRNYIYLWDVAECVAHIVQSEIEGIHLLAGSEKKSMRSMLEEVCEIFMPGNKPIERVGEEASDQIIMPSNSLPVTRSFRSSLEDIYIRAFQK
jgi:nucleoside-diphosphate-sugar epimerase